MQETQETQVRSLGQEDPLEEEMVTHSSILAWKKVHEQKKLMGCSPKGRKESDTTEWLSTHTHSSRQQVELWKHKDFAARQSRFQPSSIITTCVALGEITLWASVSPPTNQFKDSTNSSSCWGISGVWHVSKTEIRFGIIIYFKASWKNIPWHTKTMNDRPHCSGWGENNLTL